MVLKGLESINNDGLLPHINKLLRNLLPHTRANSTRDNDCTNRHDALLSLKRTAVTKHLKAVQWHTETNGPLEIAIKNQLVHALAKQLAKRAGGSAISNISMFKMGSNIIWKVKRVAIMLR